MSMIEVVKREADKAGARYGDYTSTHEALGVLVEEMAELRDAVRSNILGAVQMEAIQVAAVALRLAEHCALASQMEYSTAFAKRSLP